MNYTNVNKPSKEYLKGQAKNITRQLIITFIEYHNIDKLKFCIECGRGTLVFRLLVDFSKLDILQELANQKILINQGNVTQALSKSNYTVVKWAISNGVYPDKFRTYEIADKTNNFTIVDMLVSMNIFKSNDITARQAYEFHWRNVTRWLNERNIYLRDTDKEYIDCKRRQNEAFNEMCRRKDIERNELIRTGRYISEKEMIKMYSSLLIHNINTYRRYTEEFDILKRNSARYRMLCANEGRNNSPIDTNTDIETNNSPVNTNTEKEIDNSPIDTEKEYPEVILLDVEKPESHAKRIKLSVDNSPEDDYIQSLLNEEYFLN